MDGRRFPDDYLTGRLQKTSQLKESSLDQRKQGQTITQKTLIKSGLLTSAERQIDWIPKSNASKLHWINSLPQASWRRIEIKIGDSLVLVNRPKFIKELGEGIEGGQEYAGKEVFGSTEQHDKNQKVFFVAVTTNFRSGVTDQGPQYTIENGRDWALYIDNQNHRKILGAAYLNSALV